VTANGVFIFVLKSTYMEYTSSGKHYGINGADEFIKAILNDIALVKSPSTLIKYTFILIDLII